MNIGNITSNNFNLDGNGKDIQIEVYEQLIEQLQQENKILKENNMSMQEEMARTWKRQIYKEVIDKTTNIINDYLKEDYSIYPENEIEVDLIVKLKNILKEVSE